MKRKRKQRSIAQKSNQQPTIPSITRRHFLETGLVAGIGAVVLTPRIASSLQARQAEALLDLWPASFYKGMCYSAFPAPYDPSSANSTCIFSGSDVANNPMEPLWGKGFTSASGMRFQGRDDLRDINSMGVNLIRLYDWAPRDRHLNFLNYCQQLGLKVLAPVSNYFLIRGQGFENRATHIPNLIRSFSTTGIQDQAGTDYHPAVAGITLGNEPHIGNKFGVTEAVEFTKDWVRIEQEQFSGFRTPPIGHPVDFGRYNNDPYPQWGFWTSLLGRLAGTTIRDLQNRLFLAPQPQNDATYLFDNAESSGKGYVELTYNRFHKPLLFTEIGNSRSRCGHTNPETHQCDLWVANPNYLEVVEGQLTRSIAYGAQHPEQLKGICYFQFDDKVWVCPTGDPPGGYCPSEGTFGAVSHTNNVLFTVNYVPQDFTIFDSGPCDNEHLRPDMLTRNPVYAKIVDAYISR
jgi:hypothetical protein